MKNNIAVIGLGYVGLPLALSLSRFFKVFGFDKSKKRINELKNKHDSNNEVTVSEFNKSKAKFMDNNDFLEEKINVFIITVPTPVDNNNKPDLRNLLSACNFVSKNIQEDNLVIVESTIAPETTEKICLKEISKLSKIPEKKINLCFSPERINPGDKKNTLRNLTKIISGNSLKSIKIAQRIYKKITKKVVIANSIQSAELAKIIENSQRDLNIAFMNEIYKICDLYELDYKHVLSLCRTKWNFIDFVPGLVGGHCVPVDPYYLIESLKKKGFESKVISTSRKVNENFVKYISQKIIQIIKPIKNKNILFHGVNFKDNVLDKRNSKFFLVFKELSNKFKKKLTLHDDNYPIGKFDIDKYNIFVFGSKSKDTKKLLHKIKKNSKTNKLILNIFGNLDIKSKKNLKVINL